MALGLRYKLLRPRSNGAPKASKKPSLGDIRQAAGFYEGEGNAHATNVGGLNARVSQVNVEPLRQLQAWFGGSVKPVKLRPRLQQQHRWTASGPNARAFLLAVFPWLSSRRRQQIWEAVCR